MIRCPTGRGIVALVVIASILAGCSTARPGASAGVETVELSVLGAASLKDVLAAVKTTYESAVPGTTLTIATGASSTLRTQIEQGAPADVFLSADQAYPRALGDAGMADGEAVDFAGNVLTIVVPSDNPGQLASPLDLARTGVKVVAAGDQVPIASYAGQAVARLGALPGYPADFAAAYAANVVSKEENVRAVVAKIELGEGDAAIVYRTDAMASSRVKTIELPAEAAVSATYAGVVLQASTHPASAHAFLDWLAASDGAAVLARFGFRPLS